MMGDPVSVRLADVSEREPLTQLCLRSKAHWGYDAAFMELCRDALTVDPLAITQKRVLVAQLGVQLAGVAALGVMDADDGFEIGQFFVEPALMGKGVGRHLFEAMIELARAENISCLTILSDPHATSFYQKMGAQMIGMAPSDAIPGRSLPLLRIDISKE
ncbi:MAG: GNAT family N-acetyltransferase [Rhizobiaceae bacterium]|nr:GNAT family N-acetyltransferase [Rhizobiaceae bacterium]